MVITFREKESKQDKRYDYDTSVLRLALEKTKDTHGDFKMVPSRAMNYSRARVLLQQNSSPNFFAKLSYEKGFTRDMDLDFVPFPVDLGIVGYRTFFIRSELKPRLARVKNLADLRQFTIGQGYGWTDVAILRNAGFKVLTVPGYESLFDMVAVGRFDLLPRGANEILDEYKSHRHLPRFSYDTSLCLAYPLPRFFYTHSSNRRALKRVTLGLIRAYEDGSLKALWEKQYQKSIDFVNLAQRKIIFIPNPFVQDIDFDYKRYFYNPVPGAPIF